MNRATKFLVFPFAFLLSFLILSEIVLNIIGYSYCPLKIKNLAEKVPGLGYTDCRPYYSLISQCFVFDPVLIWRPKKNYKIFNAQGYRGDNIAPVKSDKEYRIFAVGDSNTLGSLSSPSWPEYLGQYLQQSNRDFKVINAGVWGYSSLQGLRRFEEALQYRPDMVLISFGANDAHRVTISDKEYVSSKDFFDTPFAYFKICQFFFAISDIIIMKTHKNNILIPRVNLNEYSQNLNKIITLAKNNNIKVVLLTRPYSGISRHSLWWKNFAPQYNEVTEEVAKQRGVLLIDIQSYFKDKNECFKDEAHFNDIGYRLAAQLIRDYITKKEM